MTNFAASFKEAVQNGCVDDFGRTIVIDRFGKAPLSKDLSLPMEHQEALQNSVNIILKHLSSLVLTAVFLRGSLATGHFYSDGRSDVDLLVFTESPVSHFDKASLRQKLSPVLGTIVGPRSVDIAFHHASTSRLILGQTRYRVSPELSTILRHYSLPLYGTLSDIGVSSGVDFVQTNSVRNLQRDKRQFLKVWKPTEDDDFDLQLRAIQWLCKRALRAGADFFSVRAGIHCRDLVPCYHVCTEHLPRTGATLLSALQIACASANNNFAGLSRGDVIQIGRCVAWDAAELVEDNFLQSTFSVSDADFGDQSLPASAASGAPKVQERILDNAESWLAMLTRWCLSANPFSRRLRIKKVYKTHTLPHVELVAMDHVDEIPDRNDSGRATDRISKGLTHFLQLCIDRPIIVRNALNTNGNDKAQNTEQIVSELLNLNLSVDCRLSDQNVITFCRGKHAWIDERTFTPPSRYVRMRTTDALKMLLGSDDRGIDDGCANSVAYIQTRVREGQRLFQDAWKHVRVAQEERMWICGHGTVSCLHYDAAKSALVQRTGEKRLLFLPPDALPNLGIYPLGHPLHRRARVSLSCVESKMFKDFWSVWGRRALQAVVKPGDLLLFPSMWSHYTESLTAGDDQLSISHTFRFW